MQQAGQMADKPRLVTPAEELRHKGWIHTIQSIFLQRRKEHSPMFGTLASIMVIASLILGAGGVTVASAQAAQPDEPLYSVKIWSEDTRLDLTTDPLQGYQLALEFTDRRAEEIQTMLAAGGIPPESVETRYQNQVEQTIRLALNLPDEQAVQALQQIQTRLQEQQQALQQVKANASDTVEAIQLQTRSMLQERLQWVQNALTDPSQVRQQIEQREQEQIQQQNQEQIQQQNQEQEQNRQQNGLSDTEVSSQETQLAPGAGDGNPWTTGTPTPGSSYGPGPGTGNDEGNPWTTGTPTPYSSYGPGPGTGDENPWTTGIPTPGSSYGPGSGSGTCTATCDGTGSCQGSAIGTGEPNAGSGGNN